MSKRIYQPAKEEDLRARRKRIRTEIRLEIQDLPFEMQEAIVENTGVRPLLRFARASRQSEEVVAKAFAAVFKRDLILPFEKPMAKMLPYKDSWSFYKYSLAKEYHLTVVGLSAMMSFAVRKLVQDLDRYRARYHRTSEFRVTCIAGSTPVASLIFSRMGEEEGVNVRLEANESIPEAVSAVRKLDLVGHKASTLASSEMLDDFFANLLLGVSPWLVVQLDGISNIFAFGAGGGHVSMATQGYLVKDESASLSSAVFDDDDDGSDSVEWDSLTAAFGRLSLRKVKVERVPPW